MVGGSMALAGRITPEQLTTFVLYVEFVTAASLSVCDQWGGIMESIGASERVMDYLDRGAAPQLCSGRILPDFSGRVSAHFHSEPDFVPSQARSLGPEFETRPMSWSKTSRQGWK